MPSGFTVFSAIQEIELCRRSGRSHLYLGLYVEDCRQLARQHSSRALAALETLPDSRARRAMTGWMNSDGHRMNILRGGWNWLGTGYAGTGDRQRVAAAAERFRGLTETHPEFERAWMELVRTLYAQGEVDAAETALSFGAIGLNHTMNKYNKK